MRPPNQARIHSVGAHNVRPPGQVCDMSVGADDPYPLCLALLGISP